MEHVVRPVLIGHSMTASGEPAVDALKDKRILIVEDEVVIAMVVEDLLTDLGCAVVGTASTVKAALAEAASLDLDAAILDMNLGKENTLPVAEALRARGVPFALVTGYGSAQVPAGYGEVPLLQKPFEGEQLAEVLRSALSMTPSGG